MDDESALSRASITGGDACDFSAVRDEKRKAFSEQPCSPLSPPTTASRLREGFMGYTLRKTSPVSHVRVHVRKRALPREPDLQNGESVACCVPPWGFPRREKRREEKWREEEPRTNYASHTGLSDSMKIELWRSESSSRPVFRVSHGVSQPAATFFYRAFVGSVRVSVPAG